MGTHQHYIRHISWDKSCCKCCSFWLDSFLHWAHLIQLWLIKLFGPLVILLKRSQRFEQDIIKASASFDHTWYLGKFDWFLYWKIWKFFFFDVRQLFCVTLQDLSVVTRILPVSLAHCSPADFSNSTALILVIVNLNRLMAPVKSLNISFSGFLQQTKGPINMQ